MNSHIMLVSLIIPGYFSSNALVGDGIETFSDGSKRVVYNQWNWKEMRSEGTEFAGGPKHF